MTQPLLAKKITLKTSSEDITRAGDYTIVPNFGSTDKKAGTHPAIIMKCPYCRMDMASTRAHRISKSNSWFRMIFACMDQITVTPFLQCPYHPDHKFKIVKDKIKPV